MVYEHEDKWERPVTTRRYLHPPFAEEIVTMWSQLALFIGEVYEKNAKETPGACCQFLIGKDYDIPDFKTVKLLTSEDGSPVHGMIYDFGDYTLQAESVCDIKTRPTVYTKFTFTNKCLWRVEDNFGFLSFNKFLKKVVWLFVLKHLKAKLYLSTNFFSLLYIDNFLNFLF